MSIVTTAPTLSYVSTTDISSTTTGLTKFQILFDPSVVTLGNIIMFEYKLQTASETVPNLDNTSFGYISVENATVAGISNQYVISVPAEENTFTGTSTKNIQVRVYTGQQSSNDVVVTDWSNALAVYNPPSTPQIRTAIYDNHTDPTSDNLYVYIPLSDASDNIINDYSYNTIKFIVCYWFQDADDNTVWSVSDPLTATSVDSDNYLLTVQNIGNVSGSVGKQKVYVSIHAVYNWTVSDINYYAVSYSSNEVVGVPGSSDNTPDITSVIYNVYDPSYNVTEPQTMTVTWTPPGNYAIPYYEVAKYKLYYKLNDNNFAVYQDISSNILSLAVDVSSLLINATATVVNSIIFRVDAITVNNITEPSIPSAALKTFSYSEAPANALVNWSSGNDESTLMDVNITFENPSNTGVNNGLQNFVVNLLDATGNSISTPQTIAYVSGTTPYIVNFNNVSYSATGSVTIYPYVKDTNTTNNLTKNFATANYITSIVPEFLNVTFANGVMSGQIVSSTLLAPVATCGLITNTPSFTFTKITLSTIGATTGFTISYVLQANNEYLYTFTLTPSSLPGGFLATAVGLNVSNTAGVGSAARGGI